MIPSEEWIRKALAALPAMDEAAIKFVLQAIHTVTESDAKLHWMGRFLGISLPEKGSEPFAALMELGPFNANTYGFAQGGALYTFADITMGYFIMQQPDFHGKVVTQEMKVNYVKPGQGSMLYCYPVIHHRGRHTVLTEAKIYDESGELVALATATFFKSE